MIPSAKDAKDNLKTAYREYRDEEDKVMAGRQRLLKLIHRAIKKSEDNILIKVHLMDLKMK